MNVKIINVKGLTSLTDYFINCSSQSDPQTRAIKNHIEEKMDQKWNTDSLFNVIKVQRHYCFEFVINRWHQYLVRSAHQLLF